MPDKKEEGPFLKGSESITVKQSLTSTHETRDVALPDSRQWISDTAYFKAQARGFSPEHEVSDWLEAEKEYETSMSRKWKSGLVRLR